MNLPIDASPLWISLATTIVATAATFVLGLLAAWRMRTMQGSLRAWIDGILTLPLVLPPTVVGFFLLLLFGRRSPLGQLLEQVGVTIIFSWPATVIAATVVAFPLMYRTTLGAFEQVSLNLLDAARTLGASETTVFRRVLLPIAAPGVIAGTVLSFARALGEFGATLMLAGNIPCRTQTMPLAIFSAASGGDMDAALLWVILIVALSLAIIRLLNWKISVRSNVVAASVVAQPDALAVTWHPSATACKAPDAMLLMDVEKHLAAFVLHVRLSTAQGALGLLGVSGAGKSMTLRMIAGIVAPDRGRILLQDRVLFDSVNRINLPAAERRIGVVFQDYALFPHMTVAENVGFGLSHLPRHERKQRVQQHLQRMHIADLAECYPGAISGGQRQRVAIARCMAIEPEALLFDEPFAALDPHLRRQMEEQLRETLAEYHGAVLFVTHDMEEAFRFCSDLLVLDGGQVIASGPRQQLFERPQTVAAARLTGCKNIAAIRRIAERRIAVDAWSCELQTEAEVAVGVTHVGMRSHQLHFHPPAESKNTFPCWLMAISEAPHEMTLYLCLHQSPQPGQVPHLQADVPKELWTTLSDAPQPWTVQLAPQRLLLLSGTALEA